MNPFDSYMLNKVRRLKDVRTRLAATGAKAVLAGVPGDIDRVLHDDGRPRRYPNQQLVDAMVELKMIDTLGPGIHRMFVKQRERFMPIPDYDFSNESVVLDISGKVLDERYCRILIKETNLGLDDIILLDRVQKQFPLSRNEASRLRKRG